MKNGRILFLMMGGMLLASNIFGTSLAVGKEGMRGAAGEPVGMVDTLGGEAGKSQVVRGRVTDAKNEPLPGATVRVRGSGTGTATDAGGRYELLLPAGRRTALLFTCVGMEPLEVDWHGQDTVDVVMREMAESLDEVNVISTGYGDIDRRRSTAAVTSIKMDDILVPGLSTVDQMLEGYVPGMIFMQNSGQVGAAARVRVRGTSTIIGNQEPLWVVDGIVQQDPVNVDPAQLNDLDFVNLLGNAISGLNPEDVERIDVLKDAAATAIYGTRAANGVIVITTKKGKAGPPRVSYSFSGTFTRRPRYSDKDVYVMNSRERVDVSRELFERQMGFQNVTVWNGYEKAVMDYRAGVIGYDEFKRQVDYYEQINTDWFDILCKNSFSHKHTLSLSGGSPNIRYYASVGFNDQQGVIRGEMDRQFTSSLKLNGSFDRLQFQFGTQVSHAYKKYTPSVDGQSIISYAYTTSRALPAYNEDGSLHFYEKGYAGAAAFLFNMEHEMATTGQRSKDYAVTVTGNVKYRLWDYLNVEGTASYTMGNLHRETVYEEDSYTVTVLREYEHTCPLGGEISTLDTRRSSWTARLQFNYSQEFGANSEHAVYAALGGELSSAEYVTEEETKRGYFPDRGKIFAEITEDQLVSAEYEEYRTWLLGNLPSVKEELTNLGSAYFTATYSYDDRYIFNFNARADISNQFGSRSREKLLPIWSVSGRWNIARDFWPESDYVNELALKLSYGSQGNMLNDQPSRLVISKDEYNFVYGQFASKVESFPNPDLKWEVTSSYNAELNFSVLRNRVTGTVSYYYKNTRDAFLRKDVSAVNGIETYTVNKGRLVNSGVEVSLSLMPIRQLTAPGGRRGWSWRINPQFGQVKNSVKTKSDAGDGRALRNEVTYSDFLAGTAEIAGEPLNTIYSYRFKGLSHEDGRPLFHGAEPDREEELDALYSTMSNEEVILTVMERSGTRVPVFQGGLANYVGFRQFGLSFNLTFSFGNKVRLLRLCDESNVTPYPGMNVRREFVDRWRKPGDEEHTNIPGLEPDETAENVWWLGKDYRFASYDYYTLYDYSDIRVVNGDYLKLQSLSLRYNVDDAICRRLGLSSAYVSLSGTNLFTVANKKLRGQDVTTQSGNSPTINLSLRPSYSLTLNITL